MSVLLRPGVWIAAAFVAGSGAGALGLHWVTQAQGPPSAAGAGSESARQVAGSSTTEGELETPPNEAPASVPLDREVLRAALAELLAEEEASPEEDDEQGESASEALMRLERAYRAELEAQARREREEALEASAVEYAVDDSVRAPDETAPARSRGSIRAQAEEHLDEPVGEAAVLPVDARTAANAGAHREEIPVAHQRAESAPTALVTPVQPLFFAPMALPPAAAEAPAPPGRTPTSSSPLSKPLPSAHDQSPWSPIDYSRHHNPWGATFGRRVP